METVIDAVKYILAFFLLLFLIGVIVRVVSKVVFKSFFEERAKFVMTIFQEKSKNEKEEKNEI